MRDTRPRPSCGRSNVRTATGRTRRLHTVAGQTQRQVSVGCCRPPFMSVLWPCGRGGCGMCQYGRWVFRPSSIRPRDGRSASSWPRDGRGRVSRIRRVWTTTVRTRCHFCRFVVACANYIKNTRNSDICAKNRLCSTLYSVSVAVPHLHSTSYYYVVMYVLRTYVPRHPRHVKLLYSTLSGLQLKKGKADLASCKDVRCSLAVVVKINSKQC